MAPTRTWFTNANCSVARTLEVIGERWTFLVLREAFLGVRRFDELQRNTGAARNILAARLKTLVGAGIMERRQYEEHPPRFEYRLTQSGLDLYPILVSLLVWGDKHVAQRDGPSVVLEHRACGHETVPHLVCPACGSEVGARDVIAKPGPGAFHEPV
jgi:DNA-binding HxlR family transcriptional regulator